MKHKKYSGITFIIGLLLGTGIGYYLTYRLPGLCQRSHISEKHCALRRSLDKLWTDHVIWANASMIATLTEKPEAKNYSDRLLKNQEDLGNAIAPYYGPEAGAHLTTLLKEHTTLALALFKAAHQEKMTAFKELTQKWHSNAQAIALFLEQINPHCPQKKLTDLLHEHLALTAYQLQAYLHGNWENVIKSFDKTREQILIVSKTMADGIAHHKKR